MIKIDWKRVLRTAIQSFIGCGVSFLTIFTQEYDDKVLYSGLITFGITVVCTVLMNIKEQVGADDEEGHKS